MTVEGRAQAIAWAQAIVANPDMHFVDTETLGKEHDAEICDIGIVGVDGHVWANQLIRPSRPIPDEASAIHGITNEMVAGAPTFAEWSVQAGHVFAGPLCIYNAGYDVPILTNAFGRVHASIALTAECAMLEFARFMGVPGFRGDWKWHKLEVACAQFGIPPGGHRALADAEACRQVVLAMSRAGDKWQPTAAVQRPLFEQPDAERWTR